MGIRLALGAPRTRLNWLVARRTLRQIAVGLLFGIGAATLWQVAFGAAAGLVQPTSLALAAGAMLTVGAASCWVPLRRLSRLSPLDVLRDE
jgi:ABC-type antimicrobial peptide transport system permease subunit